MSLQSPLLSPLKFQDYRHLFIGNTLSSFGGIIQMTAAAWLMTSISTSVDKVAWVQTSVALPIMLFSMLAGALSDNFSKRNIIILAQSFAMVVSLILAIFSYFHWITPWFLLSFTFLVGCSAALTGPAWQASIGDLLDRKYVPSGVLLNGISFNISRSLAPALGGLIVAGFGATMAFTVNAISYLFALYPLWLWKPHYREEVLPRENVVRAIFSGVRYVAMSPHLSRVILRSFIFCIGSIITLTLLPLIVRDRLGGDARTYGVILGAFGAGGILGAVLSNKLRSAFTNETLARLAFTLFAGCAFVSAWSTHPWIIGVVTALSGSCWVAFLTLMNMTVQLSTPRWVVGRVLSIYMTLNFTGMSVGSWIWGSVTQAHGLPIALVAAGIVLLIGAILGFFFSLPKEGSDNLTPWDRWQEPEIAMNIQPTSGPITVIVEFLIREEDTLEFLSVMHERRRVRVRDGAHNWSLTRDLQYPERWMMSYQLPTWIEYVRHHQRMTIADKPIADRLAALHQGDKPPIIHRMIERQTDLRAIEASNSERPVVIPPTLG